MFALVFFILIIAAQTCSEHCFDCFASSPFCLACSPGYQLSVDSTCVLQSSVPHCAYFTNNTHCNACQPTYVLRNNSCLKDYSGCLSSDPNTGQCYSCGFGTVLSNGTCVGVVQCNQSSQICSECMKGWSLKEGRCNDATGKCSSVSPQGICQRCQQGFKLIGFECVSTNITVPECYIYNEAKVCLICKDGYNLYQGNCFVTQELSQIYSGASIPQQILNQKANGTITSTETQKDDSSSASSRTHSQPIPTKAIQSFNSTLDPRSSGNPSTIQPTAFSSFSPQPHCQVGFGGLCFQCERGYFLNKQNQCRQISPNCEQPNAQTSACIKCIEGYQLNPANQCFKESTVFNCLFFSSPGNCSQCKPGYYLHSNACLPFSLYCTSYHPATGVCLSCINGLSLLNDNCTDPNCLFGEAGLCFRCRDGYSQSGNPPICRLVAPSNISGNNCVSYNSNGVCQLCLQGYTLSAGTCVIASSPETNCLAFSSVTGRCSSCRNGFTLSGNFDCLPVAKDINCIVFSNNVCLNCSNRYFYSSKDQKCVPINPLCQNYSSQGQCTSCYTGYRLQLGICIIASLDNNCQESNLSSICVKCFTGYYLENGKCLPQNPLCKTYISGQGSCASCYPGYSLSNGQCQVGREDPNCRQSAQNGTCLACYQGFYLSSALNKCAQISALCKGADPNGRCLDCYPGYSLSNGQCIISNQNNNLNCFQSSNGVCTRCYSGYYLSPTGACNQANPLCKTYTNLTGACTSCYPGYVLSEGQCIIPSGDSTGQANCAIRDSSNICTACYKGYFLTLSKACQKVSDLCKTYDNITGDCTSCYPGYQLDQSWKCIVQTHNSGPSDPYCIASSNGICSQCAAGYYLKPDSSCALANPLCKEVNSQNQCTSCYLGYTLAQEQCTLATPIYLAFCLSQSGSLCSECMQGYYLSKGKCVPVSLLCAIYNQQTGNCFSCIEGYVFQQGQCIRPSFGVDPNCQFYTGSFCSICNSGYRLNNYWCTRIQDANCLQYDSSSGNCVLCKGQLAPSGPACT